MDGPGERRSKGPLPDPRRPDREPTCRGAGSAKGQSTSGAIQVPSQQPPAAAQSCLSSTPTPAKNEWGNLKLGLDRPKTNDFQVPKLDHPRTVSTTTSNHHPRKSLWCAHAPHLSQGAALGVKGHCLGASSEFANQVGKRCKDWHSA